MSEQNDQVVAALERLASAMMMAGDEDPQIRADLCAAMGELCGNLDPAQGQALSVARALEEAAPTASMAALVGGVSLLQRLCLSFAGRGDEGMGASQVGSELERLGLDSWAIAGDAGERNTVQASLRAVAEEFGQADLDDLSALGTVLTHLEEVTDLLGVESSPALVRIKEIHHAIEGLILEEYPEPQAVLDQLKAQLTQLAAAEATGLPPAVEPAADPQPQALEVAVIQDPEPEEPASPEALLGMDPSEMAAPAPAVEDDIFFDFAAEADDHLTTAESTLLELEHNPEEPELLNQVFRAFHTIKGAAGFLNLLEVTRVAHSVEDLLDSARKGQLRLSAPILDVILESVDLLKKLIKNAGARISGGTAEPVEIAGFLGRVVAAANGTAPAAVPAAVPAAAPAPPPVPAVAAPPTAPVLDPPPEAAAAAPTKTDHLAEAGPPTADAEARKSSKHQEQHLVRVGTEKLDQLVNMVGELVITQTQVAQNPEILVAANQKLSKDISQLSKISKDIQEVAMSMRMVPIRGTFERMARIVRDLSRKCAKDVEFQTQGEDTELDKNVVEELVDPLTHMVRNAVDHGIETPAERQAAGKGAKGLVVLEAYHKGGNIVIELRDDGKGLNRDKILRKAIERGLLRPDEELSDDQVYDFIFHPGFSTADKISDISGRGVGLDVVRRSIESLRGKVELTSQAGQGSTFTIRLPLTLAIIDGMVVGVGEQRYILPLTSIVRSLQPKEDEMVTVMGRGEMVKVQRELFPLVRLHQRFEVEPRRADPWEGLVVLVEGDEGRYGLLVDELVGMQQVVIKGLEEDLRQERCLSGCAILGDGHVGLILDPNGLGHVGANGKATRAAAIGA